LSSSLLLAPAAAPCELDEELGLVAPDEELEPPGHGHELLPLAAGVLELAPPLDADPVALDCELC
jgi:hypothetical protein